MYKSNSKGQLSNPSLLSQNYTFVVELFVQSRVYVIDI